MIARRRKGHSSQLARLVHLKNTVRRRIHPPRGPAVVLLYHRIDAPAVDPWGNCVDPMLFAEQIAVLRSVFNPLPLDGLVSGLNEGAVPAGSVCVTFDDGYRDNLYTAKPVLERYAVPATVFVVSDHVGCGRNFWWDELETIALQSPLPQSLRVDVAGEAFEWRGSPEPDPPAPAWRAWKPPKTDRQALYVSLYWKLRFLPEAERTSLLADLRGYAGAAEETLLASTEDEICALGEGSLVMVGAHTATHPPLTSLRPEQRRDEIGSSKLALERLLGRPVDSFSYPYSDLDAPTIDLVADAGFAFACAGGNLPVASDSPVHALPRVVVENWRGEEFARRIAALLR